MPENSYRILNLKNENSFLHNGGLLRALTSRQAQPPEFDFAGFLVKTDNKTKQICFLFPIKDSYPIGGFKIAYQYADYFASAGYDVHLMYSHVRYDFWKRKGSLAFKLKTFLGFYYRLLRNQYKAGEWYAFSGSVKKHFVFRFNRGAFKFLNQNAKVMATAVETAIPLADIKKIALKNKYYLIQDYELWHENTDELIMKSYALGFKNIVIAQWLKEKVESAGGKALIVPNGLDFSYFYLKNPIENRKPAEVVMLYHKDERKRCQDSIAALKLVKEQVPELHVCMFGNPEKPEGLPEWFDYYRTPEHSVHLDLYNNAAIFVAASNKEGWALPPAESMQCGCALVCTDIGGFRDYAIDGKTALVSPVYDVQALSRNILELIGNNEKRIQIAKNANEFIQRFTLENSFALMSKVVEQDD